PLCVVRKRGELAQLELLPSILPEPARIVLACSGKHTCDLIEVVVVRRVIVHRDARPASNRPLPGDDIEEADRVIAAPNGGAPALSDLVALDHPDRVVGVAGRTVDGDSDVVWNSAPELGICGALIETTSLLFQLIALSTRVATKPLRKNWQEGVGQA